MPFKECSIVSEREEFCRLALRPGANVRELCRRFGIGSATAYKWLGRFRELGEAGLADRSRRPASSPRRTADELEAEVLAVRQAHPAWGGRKIRRALENQGLSAPSASTITAILRRHGRLDGPGAGERRAFIRFEHPEPNDLWQMDFKGHAPLGAGARLHPLTVLDDHSRYALVIGACGDERTETVKTRLTAAFRRYGLPRRILSDNGPPWGSGGRGEHTALEVWLMDLDVGLPHGRPYHPQTQGKDERFHRTLNEEVMAPRRFADLTEAQAAFDAWRRVYNAERPHEAIGLAVPADRYRPSPRAMPGAIEPPAYRPDDHVRLVQREGWISFKSRRIRCSKAFAGRHVGLRATQTDGVFDLHYRTRLLARIDLRENAVQPVHHVPEQALTMSPI
jgi:transposase InsO family protein